MQASCGDEREGQFMRIAIVGAGAIGGLLAVRLANSGQDVTVIARGAHLAAIRSHGLKLLHPDGHEEVARVAATSDCAEAGVHDAVFLCVKANQIAAVAPSMRALYGAGTPVVTMQNGLPWWYFQRFEGPFAGHRLQTTDPDGVIEASIEASRVIGSVVYPAGEIAAPGVVRHVEGLRLPLGEPDNRETARCIRLSETLRARASSRRCSPTSAARCGSSSGAT